MATPLCKFIYTRARKNVQAARQNFANRFFVFLFLSFPLLRPQPPALSGLSHLSFKFMIFINSQLTLWHFKYLLSIYPAAELPFTLHRDWPAIRVASVSDIASMRHLRHWSRCTYIHRHTLCQGDMPAAQCCGQDESGLLGWFVTHIHNTWFRKVCQVSLLALA